MELGTLALIKISSPQANGSYEPNNVKISSKLTKFWVFKGRFFFHKKALVHFSLYFVKMFFVQNDLVLMELDNLVLIKISSP